jgi:endonuclease-3
MKSMSDRERVLKIAERFERSYGPIPWEDHGDPLDILIQTILSQNTNDGNRDRAYKSLRECFPDYELMASVPVEELAKAIRPAGLHRQKAERIQRILRAIRTEQGSYDLSYLSDLSREEALKELLKFKGVGKKTAGIVLTFSLGKPYFPVDTHIIRITRRLGLVKKGQDPHDVMNQLVPADLKYQLHLHLIRHGRETCKARKPRCDDCVIRDLCPIPERGLPVHS